MLVVDDEHIIGKVVSRALSREHDVTVLTSAGDALKLLAEGRRFDVILCDLLMPQMTGMQLHAELSRALPDQAARMIFLTGGAFGAQERAFLEGGAAVLEKPFETRQLQSLVNARIV
ncbi:MAG TPA: response regulator [Polyangiaceae bacterium]|nr:response regulator [Polyangiaceae bacterium]